MVILRGITWGHDRGYGPLEATARAYHKVHPDVTIEWQNRTLSEFGDFPIDQLALKYDLLVIDYPFIGIAAQTRCLVALDTVLPRSFLASQADQSAGRSYQTYNYDEHQWALAIDAAVQVSAYRPDSIVALPEDWESVRFLARTRADMNRGKVAIPLNLETDCFCVFLTLCANKGEPPFDTVTRVVSSSTGTAVLSFLRKLLQVLHRDSIHLNPPEALERMSTTDEIAYVPLLFGYSNYSRPGYRPHLIRFANIPSAGHGPVGATLGGTGLAISSNCSYSDIAADYCMWVADPDVQRTVYFDAGGQPGNRIAWLDPEINCQSTNFFKDTFDTLEAAYVRPRYNGFIRMQREAGNIIQGFLLEEANPESVMRKLDILYAESQHGTRR